MFSLIFHLPGIQALLAFQGIPFTFAVGFRSCRNERPTPKIGVQGQPAIFLWGVFIAQQITQMLSWQKQIQAVWQPQNEICAVLASRKVYPGPGVRKLMLESAPHAPQAKKTKTSSRSRLSLSDADRVFCSICLRGLSQKPTFTSETTWGSGAERF